MAQATAATNRPGFDLHPQLASDAVPVCDLPLSRVLASRDATYPWLILVPRRAGISEIIDLDEADRATLMREIADVSHVLKGVTACDKLNVAAIGNMVPQLHVHVVARRRGDPAWPRPVWGAGPPSGYEADALERFVAAVRSDLGFA